MKSKWIKHDSLASTSSHLAKLLKLQPLDEGTVVITDYQEAGRGLGEHSWHSNRGENLLMSILFFPAFLSASSQFHLSMMVSLALCEVLKAFGIDAAIKWPNDILTAGGKIAGVLIEHSIRGGIIDHSIVGVGLNLNQTSFPPFPVPASSVRLETGSGADIEKVAGLLEESMIKKYQALREGQSGQLEQKYLDLLYRAGIPSLFEAGEEQFEGVIKGVNGYGELEVEQGRKIRTFGHGAINMKLDFNQA